MTEAVPSNIIIPFFGMAFDGSQSGAPSTDEVVSVIIGQRLSTGTVDELVPFIATFPDDVAKKAGFGSMLHRKAIKWFANNKTTKAVFVGIDDADGSAAATHAWTLTGDATEAGEYVVYVAGNRFAVSVAVGDDDESIQAAMVTKINANVNLQATAGSSTITLTLTSRNKGVAAGDLDVRFNASSGERLPAGLTLGTVTETPGTVDPDITEALAVLGSQHYKIIDQPYTDDTNLGAVEDYLESVAGPMEQRDAMCYMAKRDTRTAMIAWGEDTSKRNSKWAGALPAYKRRQSTYEISAAVAAASAKSIQDDPAVPLHRMQIVGIDALDIQDRWTAIERNQLALAGISTLTDEIGTQTDATVTMYLKNDAGASDPAYQQQNTMFILSYLRNSFRNWILTRYPRAKFARAADNVGPGQQIMTLETAHDEAVAWFQQMQYDGIVDTSPEALEQFKADLSVERDSSNVNRINWLLPPDLMNQFIVGSGVIQFIA